MSGRPLDASAPMSLGPPGAARGYREDVIDSHCHLTRVIAGWHGQAQGRPTSELLADAVADLAAVVSVGTGVDDSSATLELAALDGRVHVAVGIHPNDASQAASAVNRDAIERLATSRSVVAIGETGFDDHWQDETLDTQLAAFEWHADLAARLDKPLVLHVRDRQGGSDASAAAARAITAAGHRRGVLHCFNGDAGLYAAAMDLGWYVSFAGNLTYRSAATLREVAELVPLDRLLVETDSPFLAPLPHRGSPNRPGHVRIVVAALAALRGIDAAALETQLDANARALFGLEGAV